MQNPFSLSFGKIPVSFINREQQYLEIIEDFQSENPASNVYILTGVRGCGKTVSISYLTNEFEKENTWIVIHCSTEKDVLNTIIKNISYRKDLVSLFRSESINLSAFGFGIELQGIAPIRDEVEALDRVFEYLKKKNKKVLICMDEVISNQLVKEFVLQFQIWLQKQYPVYLLMTGLYENISNLQDEKNLTFLYRAPKLPIQPLNIHRIAETYQKIFSLPADESLKMAEVTNGYAYAYQVLGYLCFKNKLGCQLPRS